MNPTTGRTSGSQRRASPTPTGKRAEALGGRLRYVGVLLVPHRSLRAEVDRSKVQKRAQDVENVAAVHGESELGRRDRGDVESHASECSLRGASLEYGGKP